MTTSWHYCLKLPRKSLCFRKDKMSNICNNISIQENAVMKTIYRFKWNNVRDGVMSRYKKDKGHRMRHAFSMCTVTGRWVDDTIQLSVHYMYCNKNNYTQRLLSHVTPCLFIRNRLLAKIVSSGPVFIKHFKSNVYVTLNAIGSFQCNLCSHWLIDIFIT